MSRLLFPPLYLLVFLSASMAQERRAQAVADVADPNAWSVRTYRLPSDQMERDYTSLDKGLPPSPAPNMPAKDASENEVITFLKSSSAFVSKLLTDHGLEIPQGTLFAYDRDSMTLAVRTNARIHRGLAMNEADSLNHYFPQYVAFDLRLLEADAEVIRTAVKQAPLQSDHSAILAGLELLVDQGKAKQLESMRLETRSGQRADMKRAAIWKQPVEFTIDEKDNAAVVQETMDVGTKLEIDPVIGPDGQTLDLNLAMTYHYASPTLRWEPANLSGPRLIELQVEDTHSASLASAITMMDDSTILLGVWALEAVPGAEAPKKLQAAFLRACVVPVLPEFDSRVEQLLKAFGEKIEPTPSGAALKEVEASEIPPGMMIRTYHVPPDFLSTGDAAEPAQDSRRLLAIDILRNQGIDFPEHSSAVFVFATSELVVRNTPENLKEVEAFVDSIRNKAPQILSITLQMVQGNAAYMRKMESDSLPKADHTAAWEAMEAEFVRGNAKLLGTSWMLARSGQKTRVSSGDNRITSTKLKSAGDADDRNAKTPIQGAPLKMSGALESNQIGTVFEVDPVIGPDGVLVDLNYTLSYDYALPGVHHEPAPEAGRTLKIDAPSTSFHKVILSSAMTLNDGSTRLVGIWKPKTLGEGQEKDVLQAAFIRVNLIGVEKKPEK
ncbi:hypothetical protein BH11VER1_BH11VER1_12690 [soil metagenome]